MERKRVAGRFVPESPVGDEGEAEPKRKRAPAVPRAKYCRAYTRKRVAEALPEIAKTFVEEAKKGSIQHAKVLMRLSGLEGKDEPKPRRRRGKSVVGRLLERLDKRPTE